MESRDRDEMTPRGERRADEVPESEHPTTEGPSAAGARDPSERPTTEGPTTEGPATKGPTTEGPTTKGPTTEGPTTTTASGGGGSAAPPPDEPPGPEAPAGAAPPPREPAGAGTGQEGPRRLYRSRTDRVLGGVCGGLGRYVGIDPVIVRVAAVALVFLGGAGVLLYLAALLLVPSEDGAAAEGERPTVGRTATIAGAVLFALAIGALLPFWGGPFGGWGGGGFVVSLFVLGLAGLGVWWLASGERPPGGTAAIVRRAGLGLATLAVSGLLAVAGAWASAVGGGTVVAIVVIVAGLALLAGAFTGGVRWLILPALALALPAGVVSAAGVDGKGGVGDREYHPLSAADVRGEYQLGAGEIVVDLRDASLPAGDTHMRVDLGMGRALVLVPADVCISSHAHVGAGEVQVFDRRNGGADVDWDDPRRAPAGTPRLVLDGNVGLGALQVRHRDFGRGHRPFFDDFADDTGNTACAGG
jgi:phage shock protein PspC (stress-responsive transcriptional regulator)